MNNRIIKFRAWDKENKRMWWNIQDAYDTLGTHHNPDKETEKADDFSDEFIPSSFGSVLDDENYEVTQFTGLLDKNGKEIFEGDIVKTSDGDKLVEWRGGMWGYSNVMWHEKIEVIGNIYENGDLLKN